VRETLERLRISHSKFYEEIAAGRVRTVRFGRTVRISEAEIQRLASEGLPNPDETDAR
jgi:excisionase family DNA binding protein